MAEHEARSIRAGDQTGLLALTQIAVVLPIAAIAIAPAVVILPIARASVAIAVVCAATVIGLDWAAALEAITAEVPAVVTTVVAVPIEIVEISVVRPVAAAVGPVIAIVISTARMRTTIAAIGIAVVAIPTIADAARQQNDRRPATKYR